MLERKAGLFFIIELVMMLLAIAMELFMATLAIALHVVMMVVQIPLLIIGAFLPSKNAHVSIEVIEEHPAPSQAPLAFVSQKEPEPDPSPHVEEEKKDDGYDDRWKFMGRRT